jgi:sec-independent protein translocase protein TatC
MNSAEEPKDDRLQPELPASSKESPQEPSSGGESYAYESRDPVSTETEPESMAYDDPYHSGAYNPQGAGQQHDDSGDAEIYGTANPRSHYAASDEPVSAENPDEDDEGGGPVKSFLEHLEDLRWVILKSLIALILGMVVCLVAAKQTVQILTIPIDKANLRLAAMEAKKGGDYMVYLRMGTDYARIPLETNNFGGFPLGTNRVWTMRMVPLQLGTNLVMALHSEPGAPPGEVGQSRGNLINLGPLEGFKVALQVAIFGGLGLASPFILAFIGGFVLPALKRKEKYYLLRALGLGSILFCMGVLFCYFVVIPIVLMAAVNFSHWLNFGADQWRASEYIGVVAKFMLGMGLGFELPIIILTLVKLDLLDYKKLNRYRPYWIVVNLILSSVLTPPDPISMLLMAVPLQVLYEVSVLIARIWHRRDAERDAALNAT